MDERQHRNVPETPFGARLRAARKMAGLSMADLAGKLGGLVTRQAISKYERGRMMPSPEVMAKLVEVLKSATWGASPLRPAEQESKEARLEESAALIRLETSERPMFRRAGPLSRQRRKTETPSEPEAGSLRPAGGRPLLSVVISAGKAPEGMKALPAPARVDEAIQSPSSRRARILGDWDAVRTEAASPEKIRFRAGERLAAKTEAALKYRVADHIRKYLELETILGQPASFENPLAGREPRSREEVETAAARVRGRWDLGTGPIVNLLGLLDEKGIKICETRGIEGFEGLSGRCGEVVFVAVSLDRPADRIRFTAAHELGHLLCDFDAAESPEAECHAFGAAFLLPRAALEKVFAPARRKVTLGDLAEIKETFGVSLQAIMYRAHGLGLVTDRQFRSFRETLREKDWLVTEPVAYEGRERAARFRRLVHYAVAESILDLGRAAELLGTTPEALAKEIGDVF